MWVGGLEVAGVCYHTCLHRTVLLLLPLLLLPLPLLLLLSM